jgi:AraC-like DNA-binding protein
MEGNDGTTNLKEKLALTDTFPLLECMTASETKDVHSLFDASSKTSLGSFYIKSGVLKIISDCFNKLKQRKTSSFPNMCHGAFIDVAERYLGNNLSGPLPDLKELAKKLCVSESTLKRHFKKKHGRNMSSYFIRKKMDQANFLMNEKKLSVSETASLLGFQNEAHFVSLLEDYH